MYINLKILKVISNLSYIDINKNNENKIIEELNVIIDFIKILDNVKIDNIENINIYTQTILSKRNNKLNKLNINEDIFVNAPVVKNNFFVVPKIIE